MNWYFLPFVIIGLFGSLMLFTPNTLWNDITCFFRKEKKKYLRFSNQFWGRFWLLVAIFSAALTVIASLMKWQSSPEWFFFYLALVIAGQLILEIKWRNADKKK